MVVTGTPPASPADDRPDRVVLAAENWEASGWRGGPRLRAALSILRVEEIIRTSNDRINLPLQLTHARHEALAILYFSQRGGMKLKELGRRLVLHPASITSTVDSLERLGYAERVPHPLDRRATLARITAAGRTAFEKSSKAMLEEDFAIGALSEDEAEELFRLLLKVRAAHGDL